MIVRPQLLAFPKSFMHLITRRAEAKSLPRDSWERSSALDVVLDDGTLILGARALGEAVFGVIVGGQTGVVEFHEVPQLRGRAIAKAFPISGVYAFPLVGHQLRLLRAKRVGANTARPSWLPVL